MPHATWSTPAWEANRRGFYIVTDNERQHAWMREDVGLRTQMSAQHFQNASKLLAEAEDAASTKQEDIGRQRKDVDLAASVSAHFGAELLAHRISLRVSMPVLARPLYFFSALSTTAKL